MILVKHLPPEIRTGAKRGGKWIIELPAAGVALVDVERELVLQAMSVLAAIKRTRPNCSALSATPCADD